MDDEEKIMWLLAYSAKAFRGEMSKDCASFADKARLEYYVRFGSDTDEAANEDWDGAA